MSETPSPILVLILSLVLSLILTLSLHLILKRAPTVVDARPRRLTAPAATSIARTSSSRDATRASTSSTYPSATATSRQATVSRADPSAVRYRASRVPPCDPLPSAMFNATLLAARLS